LNLVSVLPTNNFAIDDKFIHTMRILCSIIEVMVLSVMALGLPFAPLVCALIAADHRYLLRYISTLTRCAQMLREMLRVHVISRVLLRRLSQRLSQHLPQRMNTFVLRENKREEKIEGECTHCGKCCINKSCVYLQVDESGASRCGIYKNWFWKQLTCGEYPISGEEIGIYECPSFQAIPVKVIAFPAMSKHNVSANEGEYGVAPKRQRPRTS
jgi:5-methylcytosine-specific restriction endonuclease McrA